jgi:hypothetical protein
MWRALPAIRSEKKRVGKKNLRKDTRTPAAARDVKISKVLHCHGITELAPEREETMEAVLFLSATSGRREIGC